MRNKHVVKTIVECKCPALNCGETFRRPLTLTYWTNSNGDLIDHQVI